MARRVRGLFLDFLHDVGGAFLDFLTGLLQLASHTLGGFADFFADLRQNEANTYTAHDVFADFAESTCTISHVSSAISHA